MSSQLSRGLVRQLTFQQRALFHNVTPKSRIIQQQVVSKNLQPQLSTTTTTKPTISYPKRFFSDVTSTNKTTSSIANETRAATTTAEQQTATDPLPTKFPQFQSWEQFSKWYVTDPPKGGYQKFSQAWWLSNIWLMLMYAVTGSTALQMVRGVLSVAGINDVSLFRGEYHHRLIYFLLMTPCYSLLTLLYGRVFGRPVYSKMMVRRIWGRFIPSLRQPK